MSFDHDAMMERLGRLSVRHEELLRALADPSIFADQERYQQVAREQASLAATVAAYRDYQRVLREAADAAELAREEVDPELREMAAAEEQRLRDEADTLRAKLVELLTPKDPMADRNIIMEIRSGTGGNEAGLFAGDLFRMYSHFAERTAPAVVRAAQDWLARSRPARVADLIFRPLGRFVSMYIMRLGFLDGWRGFVLAVLYADYVFLRMAKAWEARRRSDTG